MSEGKKSRKHGRNRAWCKMYRDQGRREQNKRAKIARHLKNQPEDQQARQAYEQLYTRKAS